MNNNNNNDITLVFEDLYRNPYCKEDNLFLGVAVFKSEPHYFCKEGRQGGLTYFGCFYAVGRYTKNGGEKTVYLAYDENNESLTKIEFTSIKKAKQFFNSLTS